MRQRIPFSQVFDEAIRAIDHSPDRRYSSGQRERGYTEKRQVLQLIDAFIERGALKRKAQGKVTA